MVVTVGLPLLDPAASAQIDAPHAAPMLIEEVERLASRHFDDRGAVEIWSKARAVHTATLSADTTSGEVATALDAMLAEFGASRTDPMEARWRLGGRVPAVTQIEH